MTDALVSLRPTGQALDAAPAAPRLLAAFLAGRSPQTLRAYRKDLQDFAGFLGVATVEAIPGALLGGGQGAANELALGYRAHLQGRGLAPATVNRRLAAIRSLVKLARVVGLVPWALDVDGVRSETYRDTRGPGRQGFRLLLAALNDRTDAKGLRDRALLRLLFDLGLRRAEAVRLDVADLDLSAGTVDVLGKGRTQKARLTLPGPTREALAAWLAARGNQPGPVFTSCDRAGKGSGRLTGAAVYTIVRRLGIQAGLGKVRSHGLRHAAITEALDLTGGDVRAVQRFGRHRDLRTLQRYDDNRKLRHEVAPDEWSRVAIDGTS